MYTYIKLIKHAQMYTYIKPLTSEFHQNYVNLNQTQSGRITYNSKCIHQACKRISTKCCIQFKPDTILTNNIKFSALHMSDLSKKKHVKNYKKRVLTTTAKKKKTLFQTEFLAYSS